MELAGKKVLVVGLGKSGEATSLFLHKKGAEVWLTEAQETLNLKKKAMALKATGIKVETGSHSEIFARGSKLVVTSPGVAPTAFPLQYALKHGIPIWSEIELAYRFCPTPILAVTGTNGKSTVVTLLARILETAGKQVVLAGNIGTPFISVVEEAREKEVVVLEVSSFQLEWIDRFRPKVGLLLNITADHLDRYPDFASYRTAKIRLFANQQPTDFAVINYDDAESRKAADGLPARVVFYTCQSAPTGNSYSLRGDDIIRPDGSRLLTLPTTRLFGLHNLENTIAVCAVSDLIGIHSAAMEEAIRQFQPLSHRMELVAEKSGVRYIDDSKATNVDATLRALQSFPKEKKIFLILGGKDKGGSYLPLRDEITAKVKRLIVLGEAADRISAEMNGSSKIQKVGSLAEGVQLASQLAIPGDTVLLSPACSSFDMFQDYAQRGDIFKAVVAALP